MVDPYSHIHNTSISEPVLSDSRRREGRGEVSVNYLIIGQGLSGTLLSYNLLREGKTVMVIDEASPQVASKVASGVINPVTGKRLVTTWMIDTLLPFALDAYTAIGNELGISLVNPCPILDFHLTQEKQAIYTGKLQEQQEYLSNVADTAAWAEYFRFNYGIGEIKHCLLININALLAAWAKKLAANGSLQHTTFNWHDCEIRENSISYKGITAEKIILCNGAAGMTDSCFNKLPWSQDKGEALIVSIPGLPRNSIYKQGISIVPWQDDLFWVGATHDWKFTDMQLTPAFRKQTEEHLNYWLKLPYEIVDHIVAQRPANFERKPFVGLHPIHRSVGILNGMGSKGCSVAPYFAHQLTRHLLHNEPLQPDVDVKRFTKILSR